MDEKGSSELSRVLSDVTLFSAVGGGIRLRNYQRNVAEAVVKSVIKQQGKSFVVMFPRQSGKNELQAQIETYLLLVFSREGGEIVKISPTRKPQSINAMRRLERTLRRNIFTKDLWKKESGYSYRVGNAAIFFLSGAPESNIVGATASLLLELDEAQDILPSKYDHEIAPMAASQNATRVFWGTAWTEDSLLSREMQSAGKAERIDPADRRVFRIGADLVTKEVPAYGKFVAEQIRLLGRDHPLVRTQYFSEELNGQSGLFHEKRLEKMRGSHPFLYEPIMGERYILLIDVAGADETSASPDAENESRRDSTALTFCRIRDPLMTEQEVSGGRFWQVVRREVWLNLPLTEQVESICQRMIVWMPEYCVVDASGVGAGIASLLLKRFGSVRILPFVFTAASKSKLGWDFLSIIDTERWQEAKGISMTDTEQSDLQEHFFRELRFCKSEVLAGAEKKLRWGVPAGTRDPVTGEWMHDDLLMSAALAAVIDRSLREMKTETLVVPGRDPLRDLDRGY